jgi:Ca2+-transporting ATPase
MNPTPTKSWHILSVADVVTALDVDCRRGLTHEEAAKRLAESGSNILQEGKRVSALSLLLGQLQNVLIIILLAATVLSAILGHESEAIAIAIIVAFAVFLGFIQEYRAEKAIASLRKMAAPNATVLRDGEERRVPATDVVPGDIIVLHAGDRVPADARVSESVDLRMDESSLTGESLPVGKIDGVISDERASVGDRKNMVYAGTAATYGRGSAIITATGMHTELGAIAGMLQATETTQTPLQLQLDRMGKHLAHVALVMIVVIAGLGLFRGQPLLEMVIFGIALAVAVVPEALPAVVTISLAIGVQRMVKRHALVRRLPAVEALGSVTTICTDKTGTLTRNEMTVRSVVCDGAHYEVTGAGYAPHGNILRDGTVMDPIPPVLHQLLLGGLLASDARLAKSGEGWEITGDPTEAAIVVAAVKAGIRADDARASHPRIAEIPFTSESKRMTTVHRHDAGTVAFAKGAPEILVNACSHERTEHGDIPLTPERRTVIVSEAEAMAKRALRVLGIAMKEGVSIDAVEDGLVFLGVIGMIDPPRPEAKQAVSVCQDAGIRVMMITGDHPITAEAIAREIGILKKGRTVTGATLAEMNADQLAAEIDGIDVFARVSPEHKLTIVGALQKLGHVVAMTGDGVNDAPALKKADIGVAMGITGTDVAKEAAAMVLTDDNFASIVAAVEEGRGIFGNIKKYLMFLLSSNIGEICIMGVASAMGLPLPLTAVQILYVNLATDGLPALALAFDPPEADLMRRPPRDPRRGILTRRILTLLLTGGLWSTVVNLAVFIWALRSGLPVEEAMTLTFVTLIFIQFFKAYSFRSDVHTTFLRPFANGWLNLSILAEFLLIIACIYLPFLQHALGTYPLSWTDWAVVAVASASVVPVIDLAKWMYPGEGIKGM